MKEILLSLKMFVLFIFVRAFKSAWKKCFKGIQGTESRKTGKDYKT